MAAKVDLYQEVTNQIIALIEEGNLSFDNGFLKGGMPCNAVTGREYSGVNLLVLCGIANRFGYASNRWLTYKQAAAVNSIIKWCPNELKLYFLHYYLVLNGLKIYP